jgi:hypothetical protein
VEGTCSEFCLVTAFGISIAETLCYLNLTWTALEMNPTTVILSHHSKKIMLGNSYTLVKTIMWVEKCEE